MTTLTINGHDPALLQAPAQDDFVSRFLDRTGRLLDAGLLRRLGNCRVLVAGCGGVGGAAALSLARLGVGRFTLADPGVFDEPDVNRQWAADTAALGRNKAAVYAEWLRRINPDVEVDICPRGVTAENVADLVDGADLAIDCLDISVDLALRSRLFALAAEKGIHGITAPVLGFGTLLAVADPHGMSMQAIIDLIRQTAATGRLPRFVREFYHSESMTALERHLAGGRLPSLSIGPVLGGALASTEALLILLRRFGAPCREPICLPRVVLMDTLAARYRVAVLPELIAREPAKQGPLERRELLRTAGFNTHHLPAERVELDLRTDSWAELTPAAEEEASDGSDLSEAFRQLYGYAHVLPVTRGRAAEAVLATALVRAESTVVSNGLFPTARYHIESRGATLLDLGGALPRPADLDLNKLDGLLAEQAVSCVWVEACANAVGGGPLSLSNLRAAFERCQRAGVPLVLDASRLLENVLLSPVLRKRPEPRELLREFTKHSDACVLSATKDFRVRQGGFVATHSAELAARLGDLVLAFGCALPTEAGPALTAALAGKAFAAARQRLELVQGLHRRLTALGVPLLQPAGGHAVVVDAGALLPHLSAEQFPAQALACELYRRAGVRCAPHFGSERHVAEGRALVRLAVPVGRHVADDLEPLVEALAAIRLQPGDVTGLRLISQSAGAVGALLARWEPMEGRGA
jgi:tryptophanase